MVFLRKTLHILFFCLVALSATGQTITYASSDPTIASVDASTGEVTANKAGSVTITATAAESGDY